MVRIGRYVYTNCWSYNNRILVIDTETDTVCDTIEVGVQPTSLVVDRHGMLWTATDGGYEGNPAGHEAAAIYRIDPERRTAERMWEFPGTDAARSSRRTARATPSTSSWRTSGACRSMRSGSPCGR